mgnify:CR=1 FL=1
MAKPINVEIRPKYHNEPIEKMIKRFSRKVKKEKVIEKYKERLYYEKPSIKKKREKHRRKRVLEKLRMEWEKSQKKI